MPTFEFTDPQGKTHEVEGPEGATREQAFQILQQRLGGTPPPASGSPSLDAAHAESSVPGTPQAKTLDDSVKAVGTATGAGAILGAASPEIIMGIGKGVSALGEVPFPPAKALKPIGAGIQAFGAGMRSFRLAETAAGALSGLISESSGQIAEHAGASEGTANAIRLGTGMLTPGAAMVGGFVTRTGKTAWNLVHKVVGGEMSAAPRAVQLAKDKLADPVLAGKPQLAMHEILASGVAHDIAATDQAAAKLLSDAHSRAARLAETDQTAAQRVIDEARARGDQLKTEARERARVLNEATGNRLATAARVQATAQRELSTTIAPPAELSDIGNTLRGKVTAEQQQALQQRAQEYQQTMQLRNQVVNQKEAAGETLDQTPGMRSLKKEIEAKLLLTREGQAKSGGLARATEPGVVNAYKKVYDAVSNKRVQTGVDESGNPVFQTFKTSFEALDHVRRKLGDAAFGKTDVEGYAGLGASIAKDLYGKISKVQEDFAGPAQRQLQQEYHEATNDLAKFGSATAGKKLTAVDRTDPDAFLRDPAALPGQFFKSQQGVRDLQELTGDKVLVHDMASQFASRQLDGRSAAQVKAWAKSNSDWMREVPGLQGRVADYAAKLERIEKVGGRVEASAKDLGKRAEAVRPAAAKEADKLREEARKEASARVGSRVEERQQMIEDAGKTAEQMKKDVREKAAGVVRDGFPAEAVRKLVTQGSPEELRAATKYLAGAPGGKEALIGSVRQVMRTMGKEQTQTQWSERVLPMLKDGGLVGKKELAKLEADVQRVMEAYTGDKRRSMVQSLVSAALTTTGAGAAAAGYERAAR